MGWISDFIAELLHPRPGPTPVPVPVPSPVAPTPDGLFAALNAQRVAHRLAPFARDPKLDAIADRWARTIAAEGELTHGDFAGRIEAAYPNTAAAAEDIADGYSSVGAIIIGWMASPLHRANILGPFGFAGVGMAKSPDGDLYVVVDMNQH